jgi:hypothetical protein
MMVKIVRKLKRLSTRISNRVDRESAPPPMLTDLRRNFQALIIGGTRLWEFYRFDTSEKGSDTRFMFAARPCRSMEGQWWTLQHMHSYMRKGGTVIMTVDLGDRTHRTRGFSYGEARTFHPLVNKSFGLRSDDAIRAHCFQFYPFYSLVLLSVLGRHTNHRRLPIPRFWVRNGTSGKKCAATIRDVREFVAQALPFCEERSLRFHTAVILPDNLPEKERKLVAEVCSLELQGIHHAIYPHPKKLMESLQATDSPP